MKIYTRRKKYIVYSRKVARRALKRRIIRALKLKAVRRFNVGKTGDEANRARDFSSFKHVHAPKIFAFLQNPEGVISFLNVLEGSLSKRVRTFVVLKDIELIDYGAITVLLSIMFRFKALGVGFNGDFPKDESTKKMLFESGFFDNLQRSSKERVEYRLGSPNQIVTHAQKNVVSEQGLPIMEEASQTIWGEKRICKGLQRVFVELMQNTNNHAAFSVKGDKHWWLSVNHDKDNKKVGFVFMDHGVGIFSSLNMKTPGNKWYGWGEKVKRAFGQKSSDYILEMLLSGKLHMTVTGQDYRGKGLPSVKLVLDRNQISNLYIITNNVYANVTTGEYRLLKGFFKGTFYYWDLMRTNESLIWNQ